MKLPNNEIGVSDLLSYRDCPTRMEFGMERHAPRVYKNPTTGAEFQVKDKPESNSHATAYGSCIHDTIQLVEEEAFTHEEAVTAVMQTWGGWLEPEDADRLRKDLKVYEERDYKGVRTVVMEEDCRVPLLEYGGETIYFRFRLDKLYQRLSDETRFVHIDYKSSRWAKSEKEVQEDVQMWAYNFGIFEVFPECEELVQVYDQLNFGVIPTRKSEDQREKIKVWLQQQTLAVLEDDKLDPTFNQWCPWCPLKMDCPVVTEELTDYAQARIGALMPSEPVLKQDGSPGKRTKRVPLDRERMGEYVEKLDKVSTARKTLEAFEEEVRDVMKKLPADKREELGWTLRGRTDTIWSPEAKQQLRDLIGEDAFMEIVGITKSKLESYFSGDDESGVIEEALGLAQKAEGSPSVVRSG